MNKEEYELRKILIEIHHELKYFAKDSWIYKICNKMVSRTEIILKKASEK